MPLTDTGKTLAGFIPSDDVYSDEFLFEFFAGRNLSRPGARLRPFAGLSFGAAWMQVRTENIDDAFGQGWRFELAAKAGIGWRTENSSDMTISLGVRYPLLGLGTSIPDEVIYYLGVSWWQ